MRLTYTSTMLTVEIELKFPVEDIPSLERKIAAVGFRLKTPRTFESNTLYDTPERRLRTSGQLLRLRRYGDLWTLTHKAHPESEDPATEGRYKRRIETETALEDGEAIAMILSRLGLQPGFRYEKWRTEWAFFDSNSAESGGPGLGYLVIDETPIGTYAELEGAPEWIDQMLAAIGTDPATCTTESYGKLFLAWKARTSHPAENLSFAEIVS